MLRNPGLSSKRGTKRVPSLIRGQKITHISLKQINTQYQNARYIYCRHINGSILRKKIYSSEVLSDKQQAFEKRLE